MLIVAGDIGDTLVAVRAAAKALAPKFSRVFFAFGNHDLWVRPGLEAYPDSISKLCALCAACDELGVDTEPAKVASGLFVVPLHSWYDDAFDEDDPHPGGLNFDKFASFPYSDAAGLMLRLNTHRLNGHQYKAETTPPGAQPDVLISASHFLPRAELPVAPVAELRKAVGCKRLDGAIAALRSDVHAFGHTHINTDTTCGRRYEAERGGGALAATGANNPTRYVQHAREGGARGLLCVFAHGGLAGREYGVDGAPL